MASAVAGLEKVPHYSKFSVTDPTSGITLRGEPDDVLRLEGNGYHIVDYKTSRFSSNARGVYLPYEVQLNAYAYIAQRTLFSPVTGLSLIYLDPDTDLSMFPEWLDRSQDGFTLGFTAKLRPVDLKPDSFVEGLLALANELYEEKKARKPLSGCRECEALEQLRGVASPRG